MPSSREHPMPFPPPGVSRLHWCHQPASRCSAPMPQAPRHRSGSQRCDVLLGRVQAGLDITATFSAACRPALETWPSSSTSWTPARPAPHRRRTPHQLPRQPLPGHRRPRFPQVRHAHPAPTPQRLQGQLHTCWVPIGWRVRMSCGPTQWCSQNPHALGVPHSATVVAAGAGLPDAFRLRLAIDQASCLGSDGYWSQNQLRSFDCQSPWHSSYTTFRATLVEGTWWVMGALRCTWIVCWLCGWPCCGSCTTGGCITK
jgi:hypothetical protein